MSTTQLTGKVEISNFEGSSEPNAGQELARQASEALAKTGVEELRELRVDRRSEGITLRGRVRSYYHKQLAQETVLRLAPPRLVRNEVSVF